MMGTGVSLSLTGTFLLEVADKPGDCGTVQKWDESHQNWKTVESNRKSKLSFQSSSFPSSSKKPFYSKKTKAEPN